MRETGWLSEPGSSSSSSSSSDSSVVIVPKRWQEALRDGDLDRLGPFDGVFYDPFDDGEVDVFLLRALPRLLAKTGDSVASFFNGLCSDNAFFHAVACEVVTRKLSRLARLDCAFVPLPLPASATSRETWGGSRTGTGSWRRTTCP